MRWGFLFLVTLLGGGVLSSVFGQDSTSKNTVRNGGDFSTAGDGTTPLVKVPEGVILVKGAWSGASDSVTPLPEGGTVTGNAYQNDYFKMRYPLPAGWGQQYEGPPPSDSGRYVLAQLRPENSNGQIRGNILITAQDLFFTPLPAADALQTLSFVKDNLQSDYKLEQRPTQTKIAGRSFGFMAYWSPVARLHWYLVETEIRCHTVEIVISSQDTKLLESLLLGLDKMTLPDEAGLAGGNGASNMPVCIKDYASGRNVISKGDPVFSETKYNPVPVRIIIDKQGRVKHIHFLSAFESQTKAISDALAQWRFKPYMVGGQPAEVETGIMFGRTTPLSGSRNGAAAVE